MLENFSAMAVQHVTQVEDFSECDLCLDSPEDPRFLPCGHVFCLGCLQKDHREATERGAYGADTIRCPDCSRVSHVPQGGLSHLVKDKRHLELGRLFNDRNIGSGSQVKPVPRSTPPVTVSQKLPSHGLTVHVHDLIQRDQAAARAVLQTLTPNNRSAIISEQISGHSALTVAIRENALDVLDYLTDRCRADVTQESEATLTLVHETVTTRFSPLTYAAFYGNVEAAKNLVRHGADINGSNQQGITPLYIASEQGAMDMVCYLVEAGAEIDVKDDLHVTSLMNACGNPGIREYLLSKGAEVNEINKDGFTSLHYAAGEGCAESVKLLVRYGAELSPQNKYGNTPLHDAAYKGHIDVVKSLLVSGAQHSARNNLGNTPLHFAVHRDEKAVVQLLLNQGADPYTRNNVQEDCFLMAVLENKTSILQLLTGKHVQVYYGTGTK